VLRAGVNRYRRSGKGRLYLLLIPLVSAGLSVTVVKADSLDVKQGSPLQLFSAADTVETADTVKVTEGPRRSSMDLLKEMLDRETGDVQIEGTSWQRKKNPRVAMLSALIFPGLGQLYNEKPFKAVLAMGAEIFYLTRILHNYRLEKREIVLRDRYPKYIETGGENPVQVLNYSWNEHDAWAREYAERQVDYIWWSAGCILVIVLDAYIDSHLHDMNFRIESTPVGEGHGLSLVIDF